jgi:hypothetical protein
MEVLASHRQLQGLEDEPRDHRDADAVNELGALLRLEVRH